jgi:hypothetical protein
LLCRRRAKYIHVLFGQCARLHLFVGYDVRGLAFGQQLAAVGSR